jgi:hypothetical protein
MLIHEDSYKNISSISFELGYKNWLLINNKWVPLINNETYLYIVKDNKIFIAPYSDPIELNIWIYGHCDLSKLGNIDYGGELIQNNWIIINISNKSGHYRPNTKDSSIIINLLNKELWQNLSINDFTYEK